jgi:hypothetical protein
VIGINTIDCLFQQIVGFFQFFKHIDISFQLKTHDACQLNQQDFCFFYFLCE